MSDRITYSGSRNIYASCIKVAVLGLVFIVAGTGSVSVAELFEVEIQSEEEVIAEMTTEPENGLCIEEHLDFCRFYDIIVVAAERYDVEAALVMAIIHAESHYDPNAISHKGARGLMQLMPRTAEWLGVIDSFDPKENVDAGVRYFKRLLHLFQGDQELALAAYNAGPGNVRIHGGVPPFPATRAYLRKVSTWYDKYKSLHESAAGAVISASASVQ